jgi:hypothetical protein
LTQEDDVPPPWRFAIISFMSGKLREPSAWGGGYFEGGPQRDTDPCTFAVPIEHLSKLSPAAAVCCCTKPL